jgi:hypothetical protein
MMLQFETQGEASARGEQQGKACRELALPWFMGHLALAQRSRGAADEDALVAQMAREVGRWQSRIDAVDESLLTESRGIARGIGLPSQWYLTALYLAELGWGASCTTCSLQDDRRGPIFIKTDDICASERGINVLEVSRPTEGHAAVQLHFAGTICTTAGMNEHGLCMGMTGIPGPATDQPGMSNLFALATILPNCRTVDEARKHIQALPLNRYGFSLQIADSQGDLALIEKTSVGLREVPPDASGWRIHTNHILDEAFAGQNPSQKESILSNGLLRLECAQRYAASRGRSCRDLTDVLHDEVIAQHGQDGLYTDYAVLFEPVKMHMMLWAGCPTQVEPRLLNVAAMLNKGR